MDNQSAGGTPQSPSTYSESSRTGSSKSQGSASQKRDLDITEGNVSSPIDLECNIQAERITKILHKAIYRTKLALCLPTLVHGHHLISLLSDQHYEDLLFIFEQYDNPLFSASVLNITTNEDVRIDDLLMKNRLNPELGHLLYILDSYPALRPKVENIVEKMKNDYLSKGYPSLYKQGGAQSGLEYLLTLEKFQDLIIEIMNRTAAEDLSQKINIKYLEASNKKLIAKINEYTSKIKVEKEAFDELIDKKKEMIVKLERELELLHHQTSLKFKKIILDSDRQMVLASRAHVVKDEMLKEEMVEARETYKNLLQTHLADENNLRARRFKVDKQLQSWIQKYDTEMGDKQVELDEITANYEDEERQCQDLEMRIAEQDKTFIPLMAERDEEYHQEMTAKMEEFRLQHAAKVIQNAWKQVIENRATKKKLLKLQAKQRQAAAAAAEEERKLGKS